MCMHTNIYNLLYGIVLHGLQNRGGENYDLKKNQVISIISENWLNIYDKIGTLKKCNNYLSIMA